MNMEPTQENFPSAWREGRLASQKGKGMEACPYHATKHYRDAWKNGWREAEIEKSRGRA